MRTKRATYGRSREKVRDAVFAQPFIHLTELVALLADKMHPATVKANVLTLKKEGLIAEPKAKVYCQACNAPSDWELFKALHPHRRFILGWVIRREKLVPAGQIVDAMPRNRARSAWAADVRELKKSGHLARTAQKPSQLYVAAPYAGFIRREDAPPILPTAQQPTTGTDPLSPDLAGLLS